MLAALFIIAACFTGIVEGALIKKYKEKHEKGGFIFTSMVSLFSMLFFIVTDTGGFNFKLAMLPYGIVSGLAYCIASFFTFEALACGPFSITMLVLSYAGVFTIAYGIFFLNEEITVFKIVGILLILLSLFLNREDKSVEDKKVSLKWVLYISLSVLSCGAFSILLRVQQISFDNAVTNEFMIVTLALSSLILFIVGLTKEGANTFYVLKKGALYFSFAGISNGVTNFLVLAINMLLPISISTPIMSGAKIIFSFILSLVIFKEKLKKKQIIAVIVGAIAIALLNIKI